MKRKNLCIAVLAGLAGLVLALSCPRSTSFADTVTGATTAGKSRGKHGGGKKSAQNASIRRPGFIQGVCTILDSPSNPFIGPCVSSLLVLLDAQGAEVAKTRTTAQGQFEFPAELGQSYRIQPGSRLYEIVSPIESVRGGNSVDVKLRLK